MAFLTDAAPSEICPARIKNRFAQRGALPLLAILVGLGIVAFIVVIATWQVRSAREANRRIARLNQSDVQETKGTLEGNVIKRTGTRGGSRTYTQYEFDYTYTAKGSLYRNSAILSEAPKGQLIVVYAPDHPKWSKIKGEPDVSPQAENFWTVIVFIVVFGGFVNLIRYLSSLHKTQR